MNIEAFIDALSFEQQKATLDILWRRLAASPQRLQSPAWHGEVLRYRESNPSVERTMSLSDARLEIKRMMNERRSKR